MPLGVRPVRRQKPKGLDPVGEQEEDVGPVVHPSVSPVVRSKLNIVILEVPGGAVQRKLNGPISVGTVRFSLGSPAVAFRKPHRVEVPES